MAGFNFLDILIIFLIVRAIIIGKKVGLIPGLFFLLGVVTANFFALHYYAKAGYGIWKWLDIPPQYGEAIAFIFLTGAILAMFTIVGNGWQALIKVEKQAITKTWGGLLTTTLSYILISAMLLFLVFVFRNNSLALKTRNGLSFRLIGKTSVRMYEGLFNFIVKPLFPREKINDNVFKIYSRESSNKQQKEDPSSGSKDKE